MVYVYILQNAAGRFYVGQTVDLATRIESHNHEGKAEGKYTRKNGPWGLVYQETWPSRSEAMMREREIKAWKSAARIRELIAGGKAGQSPAWRD